MFRQLWLRLQGGQGTFAEAYCAKSGETKADIRKVVLARRDAMPLQEREHRNQKLTHEIFQIASALEGMTVSVFWPIRSEVDTLPIMTVLEAAGVNLCLPVVIDRETITFRCYKTGDALIDAGFGTMGPPDTHAVVDPDVMFVPLAAFDRTGNRIGYGAGHYDRSVARLVARGKSPKLIGLGFAVQEVDAIPSEPHDQRLFAIVTDSGSLTTKALIDEADNTCRA